MDLYVPYLVATLSLTIISGLFSEESGYLQTPLVGKGTSKEREMAT